jgi:hypothetical protein
MKSAISTFIVIKVIQQILFQHSGHKKANIGISSINTTLEGLQNPQEHALWNLQNI